MAERQMRDARGNLIEFSASGGRVTVYVSDEFAELDADQQEELAQLYTATCWQAAQDEGAAGRPHPAVESGDADSGGEPAAGVTGAGAPAAGHFGMTDAEFERRLRLLMRVNPRLLETFFERAARLRGSGHG